MLNCHCRDCQQASGSAYAAIVVVPKAAVQIRGEPRYHKIVGEAGKAIERGFCPTCGSQVTVKLERLPDVLGLQAGSLDDPSIYRPTMDVFGGTGAGCHPCDRDCLDGSVPPGHAHHTDCVSIMSPTRLAPVSSGVWHGPVVTRP